MRTTTISDLKNAGQIAIVVKNPDVCLGAIKWLDRQGVNVAVAYVCHAEQIEKHPDPPPAPSVAYVLSDVTEQDLATARGLDGAELVRVVDPVVLPDDSFWKPRKQ